MSRLVEVGAAALGLALGVGLGWRPVEDVAVRPAVRTAERRVVCRQAEAPAPDCAEAEVRAEWCAARLRAATRPRPTTAPPEAVGLDDPDEWAQLGQSLLEKCGIDAKMTTTDCSEYPCVTAITPGQVDPRVIDKCATSEVLSDREWPALLPVPVQCGDETRTMWMYAVVDNTVFEELYPLAKGKFLPNELNLLGARRAAALARAWGCP